MTGLIGFANSGGLGIALPQDIFAWNRGRTGGALDLREGFGYAPDDLAFGVDYHPLWVSETVEYYGPLEPEMGRWITSGSVSTSYVLYSPYSSASAHLDSCQSPTYA